MVFVCLSILCECPALQVTSMCPTHTKYSRESIPTEELVTSADWDRNKVSGVIVML